MTPEPAPSDSSLRTLIAQARSTAGEQLAAVWQAQTDRVRQAMETGWREEIERVLAQRFAEIESRLRDGFDEAVAQRAKQDLEETVSFARVSSQRDQAAQLNQFVRRLRQAESRDVWIGTLLDAAATFCGRAALFSIQDRTLKGESVRGGRPADLKLLEVPLAVAPAFANVVEAQDTVVALGTRRELSDSVADRLGDTASKKVYLFPLKQDKSVVGVLYAEPGDDPPDVSALELITELALNTVQPEEVTMEASPGALIQIGGAEPPKRLGASEPAGISREERELHLRAQRFSRVHVARLVLNRIGEVKTGRAGRDLYGILKKDIDAGREAFRQQFLSASPSLVDYFHHELVRTLGNGHAELLGSGYPGPMR